jgi:hypothetical protein
MYDRERTMKTTHQLHGLGQSFWLDNITRGLLTSGTLRRYIDELSVMGLTTKVGYSKLREEIWQLQ